MRHTDEPKTIGEKITSARTKRGLTQGELGQLSGCSRQIVSQYECGHCEPTMKVLRRLARALRVSVVHLWPEE